MFTGLKKTEVLGLQNLVSFVKGSQIRLELKTYSIAGNVKQYFDTVESLYKQRLNRMVFVANKYIYNKDYSIDAVHDGLAKSVEYFNNHPDRKVQLEIVEWLIIKACKKLNRYSREIPTDFSEAD